MPWLAKAHVPCRISVVESKITSFVFLGGVVGMHSLEPVVEEADLREGAGCSCGSLGKTVLFKCCATSRSVVDATPLWRLRPVSPAFHALLGSLLVERGALSCLVPSPQYRLPSQLAAYPRPHSSAVSFPQPVHLPPPPLPPLSPPVFAALPN